MTKLDPNRTPCEAVFALVIHHARLAGACNIVQRRPTTDQTSARSLSETAASHRSQADWFLSKLADVHPRLGGPHEAA